MKRVLGFTLLAAVLAASIAAGLFTQAEKPPRLVGILQYTANNADTVEGFKAGLAAQGYREGVDILYAEQPPALSLPELDQQLAAILARKPDLLFVSPTPAALAAKRATRGTALPVVFAPVNDPVSADVVKVLHRPEANLTGVRLAPSDGRRLQELLEVAPGVRRVFVPYNPEDPSARASLDQLMESARVLEVQVMALSISAGTDLRAGNGIVPAEAQAVFLPREGLVLSLFREFTALAEKQGIPLCTPRMDQVQDGVLMGYGFVGSEIGRQAAAMAHQILEGTPVSDMPVESAQDYLFVNLDAAGRIGLDVPDAVLRRAQYVFRSGR